MSTHRFIDTSIYMVLRFCKYYFLLFSYIHILYRHADHTVPLLMNLLGKYFLPTQLHAWSCLDFPLFFASCFPLPSRHYRYLSMKKNGASSRCTALNDEKCGKNDKTLITYRLRPQTMPLIFTRQHRMLFYRMLVLGMR